MPVVSFCKKVIGLTTEEKKNETAQTLVPRLFLKKNLPTQWTLPLREVNEELLTGSLTCLVQRSTQFAHQYILYDFSHKISRKT